MRIGNAKRIFKQLLWAFLGWLPKIWKIRQDTFPTWAVRHPLQFFKAARRLKGSMTHWVLLASILNDCIQERGHLDSVLPRKTRRNLGLLALSLVLKNNSLNNFRHFVGNAISIHFQMHIENLRTFLDIRKLRENLKEPTPLIFLNWQIP